MNDLQKAVWGLVAATLVLYLAVGGIALYVFIESGRTTDSLCTFRRDLEQRVTSSREFLTTHPHGIPGISAATIRQGIANQQRTVDALSNLHC